MIEIQHTGPVDVTALTRYLQHRWPGAAVSYGVEEQTLYVQGVPGEQQNAVRGRVAQYRPGAVARTRKVEQAQERQDMAGDLSLQIVSSPVCRALWDGADLSGFDPDDVQAARDMLLRYALIAGEVPAPDWTLESRYET